MPSIDVDLIEENEDGTVVVQVPGGERVTVPAEFLRYADLDAFSTNRPSMPHLVMDFTVERRFKARYRGTCMSCKNEIAAGRIAYTATRGLTVGYVCRGCGESAVRVPQR